MGEHCETDIEVVSEYLPAISPDPDGPLPPWMCMQARVFQDNLAASQLLLRSILDPRRRPGAEEQEHRGAGARQGEEASRGAGRTCEGVVVFSADVSSAFGTTMRALALAVSRAASVGRPLSMAPRWHFLHHETCPSGSLDCYFDPVLTCRHDAPKASAYVAVFDAPCPNPLMPSPAVCAASAASKHQPWNQTHTCASSETSDILAPLAALDPPVVGRGMGGEGVGHYLDVHGRPCTNANRAGVLRLLAPPHRFLRTAGVGEPTVQGDEEKDGREEREGEQGTLWWMGTVLDLLLRPNDKLRGLMRAAKVAAGLHGRYIGVHVRHGDACGNNGRQCFGAHAIAAAVTRMSVLYGIKAVLVATDSPDMLEELKQEVPALRWTAVPADRSQGSGSQLLGRMWPQMLRTRMGLLDRRAVADLTLMDLEMLADAHVLVTQFSSAFSLVALELSVARKGYVPPFLSLDGPWWPSVS